MICVGNRHLERSKRPQITTNTYLHFRDIMNVSMVAQFIQGVFSNIQDFMFISAHFNGNNNNNILLLNRYT
jgi:hypothetical protein